MGAGVEGSVEIAAAKSSPAVLQVQLLGPFSVQRAGQGVALPKSRKARALAAYLVLAERPITRSALCELLWDSPNDPRGELRWCLSRIRNVFDTGDRKRIRVEGDTVKLDSSDCHVDVVAASHADRQGMNRLDAAALHDLVALFHGEFLEGLDLDGSPQFQQWLITERRRLHGVQLKALAQLVRCLPPDADEKLSALGKWLQLDPYASMPHELLLMALKARGRLREAEEHLAATIRLFEVEGLDWLPIREAWRKATRDTSDKAIKIELSDPAVSATTNLPEAAPARRASVAVMPFMEDADGKKTRSGLGDGLADDIITRLAKLRVLFVIARGSAFALLDRQIDAEEAGKLLRVDYVVSGKVRRPAGRLAVSVELIETSSARIVWAEQFEARESDAFVTLEEIGNRIVASIAEEIETVERNRAILKPPTSLDAWEAYHRGLWHMYRFNSSDNEQAMHFFQTAIRLDKTFSRAHAGLSFTHFQNAFLHKPHERAREIDSAYASAGQSIIVDDRDPAAHWAMGRALWLRGQDDESLRELDTSVALSPNFALGHYTVGFVHCQSGDPQLAIEATQRSQHLSPFDPLLFAMFTTQAISFIRLGKLEEGVSWAIRGASRPNAHEHIVAIAALSLALCGRLDEAQVYRQAIRQRVPAYGFDDFLRAFRLPEQTTALFQQAATRIAL